MPPVDSRPILRLGHSPDPDDAFMWWPLFEDVNESSGGQPAIQSTRFRFKPVLADIETLNQRSMSGGENELEITAISCAQYPFVQDRYAITACGASMGNAYGPKLVSPQPRSIDSLRHPSSLIAVPGERTSAFAALNLLLGKGAFQYAVVPFDQIIEQLTRTGSEFAAGVVIHEGQLTYAHRGLHLIEDLGSWWTHTRGLPLPLGLNVVRRDLEHKYGDGSVRAISQLLKRSVEYALAHRTQGVRYAMQFARGVEQSLTDRFIDLYVNKWTLDFGNIGAAAVEAFLDALHQAGLAPELRPTESIAV